MEIPDELADEVGMALQLKRLWSAHPVASVSVEPVDGGGYQASIVVPGGPHKH